MDKISQTNIAVLAEHLHWLSTVIDMRIRLHFGNVQPEVDSIEAIPVPAVDENSVLGKLIQEHKMDMSERLMLTMSLVPHLQPQLFDVFFLKNQQTDRGFTEFGGLRGTNNAGFIPTGETVAFVLAGEDLQKRLQVYQLFSADHFFNRAGILKLTDVRDGEPLLSGVLQISADYLNLLTTGKMQKPVYSNNFLATQLTTPLNWDDLVLDGYTLEAIIEIQTWITHSQTLMNDWGLNKITKPGYCSLFYGPPGTGKTLTAALLGKTTGLDVYRVDLSLIVSKYIGEAETNLSAVFEYAERRNCILFLDDADALFDKGDQNTGSCDWYAKQIAYLIQKIEDFTGIVIIATNLKSNIDRVFISRFQSTIYFSIPDAANRLKIWRKLFSVALKPGSELTKKIEEIAAEYEIPGGNIVNVFRYAAVKAAGKGVAEICYEDVIAGIHNELRKWASDR